MANKVLRIGFYRVCVYSDPPRRFDEILKKFHTEIADDESRTVETREDQPVRLQTLAPARSHWTGDMVRIRLHEDLRKVKRSGRSRKIDFDEDEGLGESTAFLFHPRTQTLAIHESRGAVPLSAFAKYFKLLGEVNDVALQPLITPAAIQRIASMGAHHKFEIALAAPQNHQWLQGRGYGAKALTDLARYFNGLKIRVSVETPKLRDAGGLHHVVDTIMGLFNGADDPGPVTKALVLGISPDDHTNEALINAIQDRLLEEVPYELRRGERISDPERHAAVLTAWNTHRAAIEQYYTRLDADNAAAGH